MPKFPSYPVAIQQLRESLESQADRLFVSENNPNSHLRASCTADAMPKGRESEEAKRPNPVLRRDPGG